MNEMSQRFINDFLPYYVQSEREGIKSTLILRIKEHGEIVKIEAKQVFGGSEVKERVYYHPDGNFGIITALRMGVKSLPDMGDPIVDEFSFEKSHKNPNRVGQ